MPHYLFTASYTTEGIKGVLKEGGSARLKAVGELVKGAGGTIKPPIGPSATVTS